MWVLCIKWDAWGEPCLPLPTQLHESSQEARVEHAKDRQHQTCLHQPVPHVAVQGTSEVVLLARQHRELIDGTLYT